MDNANTICVRNASPFNDHFLIKNYSYYLKKLFEMKSKDAKVIGNGSETNQSQRDFGVDSPGCA